MASDKTAIEWCDSSWNPVTGCSHVSAGCEACYAEALSLRFGFSKKPWTAPNAAENVLLHPERLDQPLRWRKPRRIFVNSMSDLFHERIPGNFIADVFAVMATAQQHTFQVLTKRPERMRVLLGSADFRDAVDAAMVARGGPRGWCAVETDDWPLPNVWLGVSIEQDRWCSRVDVLRDTPAAIRFISAEPLLEPLPSLSLGGIDWLIFGGESGHAPNYRSLVETCDHSGTIDAVTERRPVVFERRNCPFCNGAGVVPKAWALAEAGRLRDLAAASGTAFLFKQWGGITPKSGGRLLDGRTWDEYPKETAHATH